MIQMRASGLGIITLLLLSSVPSASYASHIGEDATADQQVLSANDQLIQLLQLYEAAPATEKPAIEQRIIALAGKRSQMLTHLIERNPKIAYARLLPPSLRHRLPASAQAAIEREVQFTGTVQNHISDDFEHGVSTQKIFLHLNGKNSQQIELHLADVLAKANALQGFATKNVSVNATQIGSHLLLSDQSQLRAAGGGQITSGSTSTSTTPSVIQGNQKTLAIMVNFTDKAIACTASDLAARLFGTTANTLNMDYQQSSLGLVSFSGDVAGPFTINYSSTASSCQFSGWDSAAEAAAKAAGYDPSLYQRVTIVSPYSPSCGWAGYAYMPGTRSWVQDCNAISVFAHELGHNLSFDHASTPTDEYGDSSDFMGSGGVVQSNAPNRARAGWLPSGSLQTINTSNVYSISAMELTAPTTPQVLKFVKADTSDYYFVSMKQPIANDASLPLAYVNTVSIHHATGTASSHTYFLGSLTVGQTYTDAVNGITITNQGISGNIAQVAVNFSGATCAYSAPTVAVSPASQESFPGGSLSYTVSVKNNNSVACGTTAFSLSQVLPAGFTGSLPSSISVAAGSTASVTWTATAGTLVASGSYSMDVTASDANAGSNTAHGTFSVVVDTTPPTIAFTSPATSPISITGRNYSLAVNASDASGIAKVEFYVDGKLLATDTGMPYSANWNLKKVTKGTHTVTARAYDKVGNKTDATASVTVY
jgi:hypothetical protein